MPGLIGRKIGMTSVFSADGKNVPCTVIEAGPCVVTQVKTVEKDGYEAVQLAFGEAKEKNTTKPMQGVFKKAGTTPKRHLAEFKFDEEYNLGDTITVNIFDGAEFVDVVGTSKGKGFQGVMKRHGFGGVGQSTHGQDDRARKPGSIGACSYPAKVFKGMRMGGMGGVAVFVHIGLKKHLVGGEEGGVVEQGTVDASLVGTLDVSIAEAPLLEWLLRDEGIQGTAVLHLRHANDAGPNARKLVGAHLGKHLGHVCQFMLVLHLVPMIGACGQEVEIVFPLIVNGVEEVLQVVESYGINAVLLLCVERQCHSGHRQQKQNGFLHCLMMRLVV